MVECQKCLDPTSLGLFMVAVVSLPLAVLMLWNDPVLGVVPTANFFKLLGIMIIGVALLAYRSDSNFGFVVFALVGAAVAMTGYGMGPLENITFAIVFILAIIWSLLAKTPKVLSLILVTTALIFLTVGLSDPSIIGGDYWHWIIGIVALFNFLFNIYLAYALALENKLPIV
ncbi:MAG: hypothetical protein LBG62_04785 [Candidatus Methanoplasma sp.]|nr:hypothetical protein [Candidatus Methanoplasma sp.]